MDEIQRKLPYAAEAEQSVLGSILIDPEAFSRVATVLSADDFYLSENRAMIRHCVDALSACGLDLLP